MEQDSSVKTAETAVEGSEETAAPSTESSVAGVLEICDQWVASMTPWLEEPVPESWDRSDEGHSERDGAVVRASESNGCAGARGAQFRMIHDTVQAKQQRV